MLQKPINHKLKLTKTFKKGRVKTPELCPAFFTAPNPDPLTPEG